MEKVLAIFKGVSSAVFAFIASALGGADALLGLMVMLIVCDIITGVLNALVKKELSSSEMRKGVTRKILIFMIIVIATQIDRVIIATIGSPIQIGDTHIYIRTLFVVYFCLEEIISLLENLANIGVPTPKWLRSVLKQVSDTANNSTPQIVVDFVKKVFNIDVSNKVKDNDTDNVEEKSEENSDNNKV